MKYYRQQKLMQDYVKSLLKDAKKQGGGLSSAKIIYYCREKYEISDKAVEKWLTLLLKVEVAQEKEGVIIWN